MEHQVRRRMKELRQERGLSQAQLAVAAGMDPATYNRLENGLTNPSLRTLERVADTLGVPVTELLADTPKAFSRSALEPSFDSALLEAERRPDFAAYARALDRFTAHWWRAVEAGRSLDRDGLLDFVAAVEYIALTLHELRAVADSEAGGDVRAIRHAIRRFLAVVLDVSELASEADAPALSALQGPLAQLEELAA